MPEILEHARAGMQDVCQSCVSGIEPALIIAIYFRHRLAISIRVHGRRALHEPHKAYLQGLGDACVGVRLVVESVARRSGGGPLE